MKEKRETRTPAGKEAGRGKSSLLGAVADAGLTGSGAVCKAVGIGLGLI